MGMCKFNNVTVQTDRSTATLTRIGTSGFVKFYTGTPIADASVTPTGTLLCTNPLSATAGVVTAGVSNGAPAYLTANPITTANGVVNGTPGYCVVTNSAGVGVVVLDVGASASGASVIMTPNTITSGAPVAISSLVITEA